MFDCPTLAANSHFIFIKIIIKMIIQRCSLPRSLFSTSFVALARSERIRGLQRNLFNRSSRAQVLPWDIFAHFVPNQIITLFTAQQAQVPASCMTCMTGFFRRFLNFHQILTFIFGITFRTIEPIELLLNVSSYLFLASLKKMYFKYLKTLH